MTIISTQAGQLLIEEHDGKLTRCSWTEQPASECPPLPAAAIQLREYFAGNRRDFDLDIDPHGTPFQLRVWRELLRIPYGHTRTYSQIAEAIGCPGGQRAVAQTCSRNPICIIIPCHRVVAAHSPGGYTAPGGLTTKLHLLNLESGSL